VFIYEPWQSELVAEDAAFAAGGRVPTGPPPLDAARERHLLHYWHFRLAEHGDSAATIRPQPEEEIVTAQMLARHQRVPEAKELLRSLLTAAPDNQTATLLLAALLGNDGERAEAHALLRRLLENHPDNARAHAQLGLILAQEGRFPDAITEWRASLALEPDQPDVRAWLRAAETRAH
jgi:tetratricopeptide (TPR) repeat protein